MGLLVTWNYQDYPSLTDNGQCFKEMNTYTLEFINKIIIGQMNR